MEIKKLREDKYEVILHINDLEKFKTNFSEFMSSRIEELDLFTIIISYIDKACGFSLKKKKIIFETFFIDNSYFLIEFYIIGVLSKDGNFISKAGKNISVSDMPSLIFRFSSFDFLCDFSNYLSSIDEEKLLSLFNFIKVFKYNNNYFLIIDDSIFSTELLDYSCLQISEFAEFFSSSDILAKKIEELGYYINIMNFKK